MVGLLIMLAGGYQAVTGKYPPGMRVGLGAPRNPVAVQVLGGIGVVIGLVLTFLALAGVSVFHLFGH